MQITRGRNKGGDRTGQDTRPRGVWRNLYFMSIDGGIAREIAVKKWAIPLFQLPPIINNYVMPTFGYKAMDSRGSQVRAEIEAASAHEAANLLRAQGMIPQEVWQVAEPAAAAAPTGGVFGALVGGIREAMVAAEKLQRDNENRARDRLAQLPVTCGWCNTKIPPPVAVTNCPNCGGTLPAVASAERGEAPPPPPRELPKEFVQRLIFWKNVEVILGVIFLAIGIVMAIPSCGITLLLALLGGFIFWHGYSKASNRIEGLRKGIAAEGEIIWAGRDTSTSINNEHPYKVNFRFHGQDGKVYDGSKTSWDPQMSGHFEGEPIWVVYVPADPAKCCIWPPLA